jgi:hypothetical protein
LYLDKPAEFNFGFMVAVSVQVLGVPLWWASGTLSPYSREYSVYLKPQSPKIDENITAHVTNAPTIPLLRAVPYFFKNIFDTNRKIVLGVRDSTLVVDVCGGVIPKSA